MNRSLSGEELFGVLGGLAPLVNVKARISQIEHHVWFHPWGQRDP